MNQKNTVILLTALALTGCVHRTIRYETTLKTDAEGTVTHEGLTIRHRGVTLVPNDLFVTKQDCLVSGKPVVPERVVEVALYPKGEARPEEPVVIWEKITITNNTEHIIYPFATDQVAHVSGGDPGVYRRVSLPKILLLDAKQEKHEALTEAEAITLFEAEQPCATDLFKRKAVYEKLNYFDYTNAKLELLPGVDWTGWVAYKLDVPRGGNTGHWTFGFYEMPVGADSVGGLAHTAAFQFGVDVQAYVDHFKWDVRQASYALPEIQSEDSL